MVQTKNKWSQKKLLLKAQNIHVELFISRINRINKLFSRITLLAI